MWRPVWLSKEAPSELKMRGVGGERGVFGALGGLDLQPGFQQRYVGRIQPQVAGDGAHLAGIRQAGVRVFIGDIGQLDGRLHQPVDSLR